MIKRLTLLAVSLGVVSIVPILGPGVASAQYDYGGSGFGSTSSDDPWTIALEAILTNPRNTDNVVASSSASQIIPTWSEDVAGRIGMAYEWDRGRKVMASFWGYQTDVTDSGSGFFEFPIGPTVGTSYDVMTEIVAQTADVGVGVEHAATRDLTVEWSVGFRYAYYEENTDAVYGTAGGDVLAAKRSESSMIGARLGLRASYTFSSAWSLGTGLGYSFLDGEVEASSMAGPSIALLTDNGRSGNILDFDVTGRWQNSTENVAIVFGWEQSVWEDIATDLLRNPAGTTIPLRDRDSVTFSGYKLGLHVRF